MGSFPFGSGARSPGIRVTAWRLLNSVILLVFGVTKAVYAYLGHETTPTTLEWLLGVSWALMYGFPLPAPDVPFPLNNQCTRAYWVGWVEAENPSAAPLLFEVDLYQTGMLDVPIGLIVLSLAVASWGVGQHLLYSPIYFAQPDKPLHPRSAIVELIDIVAEKVFGLKPDSQVVIRIVIRIVVMMVLCVLISIPYIAGFLLVAQLPGLLAWINEKATLVAVYFSREDWGVERSGMLIIIPIYCA